MAKEAEEKTVDVNAAKLKALQATIDKIEKDFGKGTIMKLGEQRGADLDGPPAAERGFFAGEGGGVAAVIDKALGHERDKPEVQSDVVHGVTEA